VRVLSFFSTDELVVLWHCFKVTQRDVIFRLSTTESVFLEAKEE